LKYEILQEVQGTKEGKLRSNQRKIKV